MNIVNALNEIKDYIIPMVTLLIGAKFDFLKNKLSVRSSKLDNVAQEMSIYRDLLDDFEKRHLKVVDHLKSQVSELEAQLTDFEKLVKDQKSLIVRLTKSLSYYENKYGK